MKKKTKDGIQQWIREAVTEESKRLVQQELGKFDIDKRLNKIISEKLDFSLHSSSLPVYIAHEIVDKFSLKFESKEKKA